MSMYTALSGLTAAQSEISVTSHNISNIGVNGYKGSRTEFTDIFSASPLSVARMSSGLGTQVARTSQSFSQGNVVSTGNVLDIAIEGSGFFVVRTIGGSFSDINYTRSGAFSRDSDGTVVNTAGAALIGWPVAQDGTVLSSDPSDGRPIQIPPAMGESSATSKVDLSITLPNRQTNLGQQNAVPPTSAFSPNDPSSYAFSTPLSILENDGSTTGLKTYFIKTANIDSDNTADTWSVRVFSDTGEVPTQGGGNASISFDTTGAPIAPASTDFNFMGRNLTLDLSTSTMENADFNITTIQQDGASPSTLHAVEVGTSGTVYASYSSGENIALGKIMLANFVNSQGLRQMGATALATTETSGAPILGVPSESGVGLLRSGSLERSNVELTQELVNLISAQRNYQASAKAMETSTSLSQTIINIRS